MGPWCVISPKSLSSGQQLAGKRGVVARPIICPADLMISMVRACHDLDLVVNSQGQHHAVCALLILAAEPYGGLRGMVKS